MQMVKKIFLGILLFGAAILLFMPKEEIYFKLERELAKKGVEINERRIEETPWSLTIEGVTIYVEGIPVAKIESLRFFSLLLFNRLEVKHTEINEGFGNKIPSPIEEVRATYAVWMPTKTELFVEGAFGKAVGDISLVERRLYLRIEEEKAIDSVRSLLKKGEKGLYYEISF